MHKALGRGLEALIPKAQMKEAITTIQLKDVQPNKYQARKVFDNDRLNELAASIKKQGMVQPVLVSSSGSKYKLVAGERRYRAAKIAGLKSIPAIVRDVTDEEMFEISLIENLQRENLNPLEEAEGYKGLMDRFKLTQEDISSRLHKSRPLIANTLRLLSLPTEVRDMLRKNMISSGHAKVILSLKTKSQQVRVAKNVITKKLSVRDTERLAAKISTDISKTAVKTRKKPEIAVVEDRLIKKLGTKVKIADKGKKGRVIISYSSLEELNRIIHIIVNR